MAYSVRHFRYNLCNPHKEEEEEEEEKGREMMMML